MFDRGAHQSSLSRHEWLRVVERGELRAEGDDEVVVGGIDLAVFEVDPVRLHVGAVLCEPSIDVPRRRRVLVLEDQGPQRGRIVLGTAHRGPPIDVVLSERVRSGSTSSAT